MGCQMIKKNNLIFLVLVSAFIAVFIATYAGLAIAGPTGAAEIVKTTVDNVKQTVDNEKSKISEAALDAKLHEIIAPVFDFKEMARRSLAAHWSQASPTEQTEFVELFSKLLADNYIKKIRENVGQSNFTVAKQESTGPESVLVKTSVLFEGKTASIDYRLRMKDSTWKVYDVVIENIGLVSNYRSEFGAIIDKDRISGLLKQLRDKNK